MMIARRRKTKDKRKLRGKIKADKMTKDRGKFSHVDVKNQLNLILWEIDKLFFAVWVVEQTEQSTICQKAGYVPPKSSQMDILRLSE